MSPHKDTSSPIGSFTPSSPMPSRPINSQPLTSLRNNIYSTPDCSSSESSFIAAMHSEKRPLVEGVYVPTMTPFDSVTEDLNLEVIASHAVRLAEAGVAGLATMGSNGEAVHLTHQERKLCTYITRKALDDADFTKMPIIVGCGAQSTRETITLCQDAYESGADYALILPPSYYSSLFAPSSASIIEFFTKVADASPIPILIYNYPGAVSGLDLNSDIIIQLSHHENIAGVKLTCGNTGKLNRIVAGTRSKFTDQASGTAKPDFFVLGGSADFTLQSLIGGGHGILAGLANIVPKACVKIISLYNEGNLREAQALQEIVARADWEVIQTGVVGTKSLLKSQFGYGGYARSPLPRPTPEMSARLAKNFAEVMNRERLL